MPIPYNARDKVSVMLCGDETMVLIESNSGYEFISISDYVERIKPQLQRIEQDLQSFKQTELE